jgi:hypothetical protein
MASNEQEIKIRLNEQEDIELSEGRALDEMTKTRGFQILRTWLEQRVRTHADPRECASETEWKFKELNAFWSGMLAQELLDNIFEKISRSEYLDKVKKGEVERGRMRI